MTIPTHSIRRMAAASLAFAASLIVPAQTDTTRVTAAVQGGEPVASGTGKVVHKEHAHLFGIAHANILDTYLSQETFRGTELRYVSQMFRQREGSRVSTETLHQVFMAAADSRGNSKALLTALYNLRLGWHYNWAWAHPDIRLKVGGMLDATLGGAYNTRNSNNPAQARASLSIDPSARLSWAFSMGGRRLVLSYEAAMPIVGLAFSPNYGQSYYEIFSENNYDHNIVPTSPFSAIEWHHTLTLDFRLWRKTFSIGYIGDIRQMKANNLKNHHYTHGLLVGWKY